MNLLDLIFPKRCVGCKAFGAYICTDCFSRIAFFEKPICLVCQRPAVSGLTHPVCTTRYTIDGTFISLVYSGVVKRLVYQFKFAPFVSDLQQIIGDLFYEGLIQQEQFYSTLTDATLFVPIPLHGSKLRKRGYNQALLLAQGLSRKCQIRTPPPGRQRIRHQLSTARQGFPVWDCLRRVKNTHTQVGLAQKDRRENIRGAFILKTSFEQAVKHLPQVFLIDDICTSGATLLESARILKKAGVGKVWGVTLAHGL